jgi:hypothetical protein
MFKIGMQMPVFRVIRDLGKKGTCLLHRMMPKNQEKADQCLGIDKGGSLCRRNVFFSKVHVPQCSLL